MSLEDSLILPDLLQRVGDPDALEWQPFRAGVRIHPIYGEGGDGPSAALLRYSPGASVPTHTHIGHEHVLVLSGSQVDGNGTHAAGTLVVNPPGSSHRVISPEGCVVLVIWERPVRFNTP